MKQDWNIGTLLNTSGGYWQAFILHAAVGLDLFSAIGDNSKSAAAMAKRKKLHPRALERLLNALTAMGLLEKNKKLFKNTTESRQFLCKDSPAYIGFIIRHHRNLVQAWAQLPQVLETGDPVERVPSTRDEETLESFLLGMNILATAVSPSVLKKIDLSQRQKLLDLGGGPGTHAIKFCEAYPNLSACVYDRPTSRKFAEKQFRENNMENRISFIDGDFTQDPIPGEYDVIWISQALHSEGQADCTTVLQKAAATLATGGEMIVHEFILDNNGTTPTRPAIFSLNMLVNTPNGRSYTEKELHLMMKIAGLKNIRRVPLDNPGQSGLMIGYK